MLDKYKKRPAKAQECSIVADWPPAKEMDWTMVQGTKEKMLHYDLISCKASALTWIEKTSGAVRIPSESTQHFVRGLPFLAAGKRYFSLSQLTARQKEPGSCWYLDCYGRKVLQNKELFPCFDSSDTNHETRYYRWFYLCEKGTLTRIYATDTRQTIYVTKDAAFLENAVWRQLKELDCLDRW